LNATFVVFDNSANRASQVSGLPPTHYEQLVLLSKSLALKVLPKLFNSFRDLCLPFLPQITSAVVDYSRDVCLKRCDIEAYFEVLDFCRVF